MSISFPNSDLENIFLLNLNYNTLDELDFCQRRGIGGKTPPKKLDNLVCEGPQAEAEATRWMIGILKVSKLIGTDHFKIQLFREYHKKFGAIVRKVFYIT